MSSFRDLHVPGDPFVMANPWDAASVRFLEDAGAQAIATSSAGYAHRLGRRDSSLSRAEAVAHGAHLVSLTDLPVNGDLEDGFGPGPEDAATTVTDAAAAGMAGCSIEDTTRDPSRPIHEFGTAVQRIEAAVAAAQAAPGDFVLTARAENLIHGRHDLDDTVARVRAFAAAGADVVYAPGLADLDAVRAVVAAVDVPVNVLATPGLSLLELASAGVARISLGSGLSRYAMAATRRAVDAMLVDGDFGWLADAAPFRQLEQFFD